MYTNTEVTKILHIALGWVKNQSSWETSILQDYHSPLSHLESRWIPLLQLYLQGLNNFLCCHYTAVYKKQQAYDTCIMVLVI